MTAVANSSSQGVGLHMSTETHALHVLVKGFMCMAVLGNVCTGCMCVYVHGCSAHVCTGYAHSSCTLETV